VDDVTIRDYTGSDLDAVLKLNVEAWDDLDAPEAHGGIDAPDLQAIPAVYLRGGAFLIAEADGDIVGMAGLQKLTAGAYEMRRVRVAVSHQGKGIGKRLAEEIETRARDLGARRIIVNTTVRQASARHVYETLNYTQTGTTVLEDRHGRFDVVQYEKKL
jgi:N-acetylglutamate synthase-like GNAT family acetyltransferase